MYPYQRTPMGNPYISLYSGCLWVESLYKPYKYHGYTVRGTPNCPLNDRLAGVIDRDILGWSIYISFVLIS